MSTPDNPLPVITRKRESRLNVPHTRKPDLSPEEWAERQAKLQKLHMENFIAQKQREHLDYKASLERKRYLGLKTSSEKIDGVEEVGPDPIRAIRAILPSRGPKTDGGSTVIDEGEVPIVRGRTKKVTKVEAERARRVQIQKKAKRRKVIM
jgi:hypothetical protein